MQEHEDAEELPSTESLFTGHDVQTDSDVPVTIVENLPFWQGVHGWVPYDGLYEPAAQAVHAPPRGFVYPAHHCQIVIIIFIIASYFCDRFVTIISMAT